MLSFTTNIYTYCMTNVESPFNICQLCWHTVVHTVWQPVISCSLYIYKDFTCRQKFNLLSPCFWECDSKVRTISLHFNKTIYTRTGTCSCKIHILPLLISVPLRSFNSMVKRDEIKHKYPKIGWICCTLRYCMLIHLLTFILFSNFRFP